ncbi:MAG: hydroxyacylglutathione hydrolase, partial [Planctomycetes bacterium]|nr:hydroxyacylglutathione hydrolase [Planctomycetota bacterium]
AKGEANIDSTIEQERETNIFLRSGHGDAARGVGMEGSPAAKVFAELRRRKDAF